MCTYKSVVRTLAAVAGTSGVLGLVPSSPAQVEAASAFRRALPARVDLIVSGDAVTWMHEVDGRPTLFSARAPEYRPRRHSNELDDGPPGIPASASPLSPDRAWVLYLREGLLYRLPADNDGMTERGALNDPLFSTIGVITEAVWSPVGSRIAFVMLAPKARSGVAEGSEVPSFVGIFDLESGRRWFLRPALARDSSPVWSMDGSEVFFRRTRPVRSPHDLSRILDAAEADYGHGAVLIGEVESGDVRVLWCGDDQITLIGPHTGNTYGFAVEAGDRLPVQPGSVARADMAGGN